MSTSTPLGLHCATQQPLPTGGYANVSELKGSATSHSVRRRTSHRSLWLRAHRTPPAPQRLPANAFTGLSGNPEALSEGGRAQHRSGPGQKVVFATACLLATEGLRTAPCTVRGGLAMFKAAMSVM